MQFRSSRLLINLLMLIKSISCDVEEASLNAHNIHRRNAGLDDLVWDDSLESSSQEWSDKLASSCNMDHSQTPDLGENVYMSSQSGDDDDIATMGCESWYEEVSDYQYPGETDYTACGGGMVTGHLTQMMWKDSVYVGCAVATCSDGAGSIYTCQYSPAGNVMGQEIFSERNYLKLCSKEDGLWRSCDRDLQDCGRRSDDAIAFYIREPIRQLLFLTVAVLLLHNF